MAEKHKLTPDHRNELAEQYPGGDYSDSWSYVMQSTFFGGYIHQENESAVLYTTRYPNQTPYVITKWLGPKGLGRVPELAETLERKSGKPVIVKNLSENEFSFLERHNFRSYAPNEGWHSDYRYDEDTFPQTIVDLDALVTLKGPALKRLRHATTHFRKRKNAVALPYHPSMYEDAVRVLSGWERHFSNRFDEKIRRDPLLLHSVDLHHRYMESLYTRCDEKNVFSYVFYLDGKPEGFSLAERTGKQSVGLYCNISTNRFPGFSETIVLETLRRAHAQGMNAANLGGSEFESLHQFKQKFGPSRYIQKTHAVFDSEANGL
ncbi:DUF2156 domain-containing protein [Candidatus Micrarchaeota archaeon]|nr:DUF2156 domain-containing protein [Candidatus Micrarchaeota archaeon]